MIHQLEAEFLGCLAEVQRQTANPDSNLVQRLELLWSLIRKRLEAQEKERQARLYETKQMELALAQSRDAIGVIDRQGMIRLANPKLIQQLGRPPQEVLGADFLSFWQATIQDRQDMSRALQRQENWQAEWQLADRSQSSRHQVCFAPIVQPDGQVHHQVVNLWVLDGKERLNARLRAQKQLLERLLNQTDNLLILMDRRGRWYLDNLAAKTLLADLGNLKPEAFSQMVLEQAASPGGKRLKPSFALDLEKPLSQARSFLVRLQQISARFLDPDWQEEELLLVSLTEITQAKALQQEISLQEDALLARKRKEELELKNFSRNLAFALRPHVHLLQASCRRLETDLPQVADTNQWRQLLQNLQDLEQDIQQASSQVEVQIPLQGESKPVALLDYCRLVLKKRLLRQGIRLHLRQEGLRRAFPFSETLGQMLLDGLTDQAEARLAGQSLAQIELTLAQDQAGCWIELTDNSPAPPSHPEMNWPEAKSKVVFRSICKDLLAPLQGELMEALRPEGGQWLRLSIPWRQA